MGKNKNPKILTGQAFSEEIAPKQIKNSFTLTEVIVVIVIIAALAIILIPNMLSLMPDDHNIKYKKAFYTIQEIVNDIANECQGLYRNGDNWYSIEEWNASHPDDQLDSDNVLSFCYNSDGTRKILGEEICKRLSTTTDCSSATISHNCIDNIQTTNGMKWVLPQRDIGDGHDWGFPNSETGKKNIDIYVSLDGSDVQFDGTTHKRGRDVGVYVIRLNSHGKVTTPDVVDKTENRLLLDNPTKD